MERIEAIRERVGAYVALFDKLRDAANDPDGTGDFARLRRAAWNVDDCAIMDDLEALLNVAHSALAFQSRFDNDPGVMFDAEDMLEPCRRFREGE